MPENTPSTREWLDGYRLTRLRLSRGQRVLDLRRLDVRERLRPQLAQLVTSLQLPDFDASIILNNRRELTQAISRWAYDTGTVAIAYHSRLDDTLTNWAVFDIAGIEWVGEPLAISPEDRDLQAVVRACNLRIETD